MVFYFKSNVVQPEANIFMGKDKYENEDLLKWGWPEDIWFHVSKLSSAHVYLRLREGESIDNIPSSLLDDCCQLVKANSIQGNKMNDVEIIYTQWTNLKKTPAMDVGQVAFHNEKEVKKAKVEKRIDAVINRLEKTKVVIDKVDFRDLPFRKYNSQSGTPTKPSPSSYYAGAKFLTSPLPSLLPMPPKSWLKSRGY